MLELEQTRVLGVLSCRSAQVFQIWLVIPSRAHKKNNNSSTTAASPQIIGTGKKKPKKKTI